MYGSTSDSSYIHFWVNNLFDFVWSGDVTKLQIIWSVLKKDFYLLYTFNFSSTYWIHTESRSFFYRRFVNKGKSTKDVRLFFFCLFEFYLLPCHGRHIPTFLEVNLNEKPYLPRKIRTSFLRKSKYNNEQLSKILISAANKC